MFIFTKGENIAEITKEAVMNESCKAPVKAGDKVGEYRYYYGKDLLGSVAVVATEEVKAQSFSYEFLNCMKLFFREE